MTNYERQLLMAMSDLLTGMQSHRPAFLRRQDAVAKAAFAVRYLTTAVTAAEVKAGAERGHDQVDAIGLALAGYRTRNTAEQYGRSPGLAGLAEMAAEKHRARAINEAALELESARQKFPPMHSAHEGFAVLMEEVTELQGHVYAKQSARDLTAMRKEAIQVAAMALAFAAEVCNEEVGRR